MRRRPVASIILWACMTFLGKAQGELVSLNDNNIAEILGSNDIAIVNFYADWCRFSQMLAPTFEEASKKADEVFTEKGKVVFAKVDSDRETNIAQKYRINKYPTIKLFRMGEVVKKEYRGQRSVEAMVQFAKEQSEDSVEVLEDLSNFKEQATQDKKRHIIGFFEKKESENYRVFSKVASLLRDDCKFRAAFGDASKEMRPIGDSVKIIMAGDEELQYTGAVANYEGLQKWATENGTPLVREITFENAEELTEEGLPFLILFHHPDDKDSVNKFRKTVESQVAHEKVNINFLTADGLKFAHPLHHLGKSTSDLPIICIDSFRHMYLFPHDVKTKMDEPGLLKQFIEALHSGKLHREFHHGPDPTQPPAAPQIEEAAKDADAAPDAPAQNNIPRDASEKPKPARKATSPPVSTFRKLAPSGNRYTILRDEL